MITKKRTFLMNLHKNEAGFEPLQVVAILAISVMVIGATYKVGKRVYNWATGTTTTLTQPENVGKTQQGFGLVDGEAVENPHGNTNTHTNTNTQSNSHHHQNNNNVIVDPGPSGGISGGGSPQ